MAQVRTIEDYLNDAKVRTIDDYLAERGITPSYIPINPNSSVNYESPLSSDVLSVLDNASRKVIENTQANVDSLKSNNQDFNIFDYSKVPLNSVLDSQARIPSENDLVQAQAIAEGRNGIADPAFQSVIGKIGAFGGGAANSMSLGMLPMYWKQNQPETLDMVQQLQKQYPTASKWGNVAGYLVPTTGIGSAVANIPKLAISAGESALSALAKKAAMGALTMGSTEGVMKGFEAAVADKPAKDIAVEASKGFGSGALFGGIAGPVSSVAEGLGGALLSKTPDAIKNSLAADIGNRVVAGGIGGAVGAVGANQVYAPGTLPDAGSLLEAAVFNAVFHGLPGAVESISKSKNVSERLTNNAVDFQNKISDMLDSTRGADVNTKVDVYKKVSFMVDDALNALKSNRYPGNNKQIQEYKNVLTKGKNNLDAYIKLVNDTAYQGNRLNDGSVARSSAPSVPVIKPKGLPEGMSPVNNTVAKSESPLNVKGGNVGLASPYSLKADVQSQWMQTLKPTAQIATQGISAPKSVSAVESPIIAPVKRLPEPIVGNVSKIEQGGKRDIQNVPKNTLPEKPVSFGAQRAEEFKKNIIKGEPISHDEFKKEADFLINNEAAIKADLNKLTVPELKQRVSAHESHYLTKKAEFVDKIYDGYLSMLYYGSSGKSSISYGMDRKYRDVLRDLTTKSLNELTPEKLATLQAQYKAEFDDMMNRRKAMIDGVKNPQTLEDFERKKRISGLTDQEQVKYDELYAESQQEKRNKNSVLKGETAKVGDYTVTEDIDTRDNSKIFVIRLGNRIDSEAFAKIRDAFRNNGIHYSRFKKGFISKIDPTETLQRITGESSQTSATPTPINNSQKLYELADKLQQEIDEYRRPRLDNTQRRARMADNAYEKAEALEQMQNTLRNLADAMMDNKLKYIHNIDSKAQISTLRRILTRAKIQYADKEFASFRNDYAKFKAARESIKNEDAIKYAELPQETIYSDRLRDITKLIKDKKGFLLIANRFEKVLANVKEPQQIRLTESLRQDLDKVMTETNVAKNMYIEEEMSERKRLARMGIETTQELRAYLREFVQYIGKTKNTDKNREIKNLERELIGKKIEGYFPTPKKVVEKMLDLADVQPGDRVLEPSAGKGSIADAVKESSPDANIDVIEIEPRLREILSKKGYNLVGRDFVEESVKHVMNQNEYDKIIMNPPFEGLQDVQHVMQAYDLLKPGGRLVSIMSESPFFRSDKRAVQFREWLDEVNGQSEKLPEGSFKESDRSTGVNTRIVTIDKPINEVGHEKEMLVNRRIESQAFEQAMDKMGYKTLEDKAQNSNNTQTSKPMFINQSEEFNYWKEYYKKELSKDSTFIKKIVEEYDHDANEVKKNTYYEGIVWNKEDWEIPREGYFYKINGTTQKASNTKYLSEKHEAIVKKALNENKPVPQDVLKDYPDIKNKIKNEAKRPWTDTIEEPPKEREHISQAIWIDSGRVITDKNTINQFTNDEQIAFAKERLATLVNERKELMRTKTLAINSGVKWEMDARKREKGNKLRIIKNKIDGWTNFIEGIKRHEEMLAKYVEERRKAIEKPVEMKPAEVKEIFNDAIDSSVESIANTATADTTKQKSFKKQDVEISVLFDGEIRPVKVPAEVYKGLAVAPKMTGRLTYEETKRWDLLKDNLSDKSFTITHAKSGIAIIKELKKDVAKNIARNLADAVDFTRPIEDIEKLWKNEKFKKYFNDIVDFYRNESNGKKFSNYEAILNVLPDLRNGTLTPNDFLKGISFEGPERYSGFSSMQREQFVTDLITKMATEKKELNEVQRFELDNKIARANSALNEARPEDENKLKKILKSNDPFSVKRSREILRLEDKIKRLNELKDLNDSRKTITVDVKGNGEITIYNDDKAIAKAIDLFKAVMKDAKAKPPKYETNVPEYSRRNRDIIKSGGGNDASETNQSGISDERKTGRNRSDYARSAKDEEIAIRKVAREARTANERRIRLHYEDAFNVKVRFFDGNYNFDGFTSGQNPNEIFINSNANKGITATANHELFHSFSKLHKNIYFENFYEFTRKFKENNPKYLEIMQKFTDEFEPKYRDFLRENPDVLVNEIIANEFANKLLSVSNPDDSKLFETFLSDDDIALLHSQFGGFLMDIRDKLPYNALDKIGFPFFSMNEGKPVEPFFSKLQQVIQSKMPNKAEPNLIYNLISKAGVKDNEVKWSGITYYLRDKEKVNKADLLEFLRLTDLKIDELLRTDPHKNAEFKKKYDEIIDLRDRGGRIGHDEARRRIAELTNEFGISGEPKYGRYTLPQGEQYKELLFQLPVNEANEKYRSSHWDEPNIVAHVRFNEREDTDGNKVLFMEEIQSDWHQDGRRKGYKTDDTPEYRALVQETKDFLNKHAKVDYSGKFDDVMTRAFLANNSSNEKYEKWFPETFLREKFFDFKKKFEELDKKRGKIPDAPFKKTWHEFILKRMLRYAAENGFDKLSWAGGDVQNERYNLEQHVGKILYEKSFMDDRYTFSVYSPEGSFISSEVSVPASRVEDVLGIELGQKIINAANEHYKGELSGLDLKLNGEGMRGFYDKIIPDFLNKYGKRWGAKVENVTFPKLKKMNDKPEEKFQAIPITESMKDSVLFEGQPLFARKQKPGEGEKNNLTSQIPWDLPPASGSNTTGKAKRASEIIKEFEKKFMNKVRTGRVHRANVLGYFKTQTYSIRLKKANDIPTFTHEAGHLIDALYNLRGKTKTTPGINVIQLHRELETLGKHSSPPKAKTEYLRKEGIAEFTRLFLTDQPQAFARAPETYEYYKKMVDPDLINWLQARANDISDLVNLSPVERVKKDVVSRGEIQPESDFKAKMEHLYADWIDEYYPVYKDALELGGEAGEKRIKELIASTRGYESSAMFSINPTGNKNMHQTDLYGNNVGPSLYDIMTPLAGDKNKADDFWNGYAVARRAEDYNNRKMQLPQDWETYKQTRSDLEKKYPDFPQIFDAVRKYDNNLLLILHQSGFISKQQMENIQVLNPNHINLFRVRDEVESMPTSTRQNPIKNVKGGGEDIINPFESLVNQTFIIWGAAKRQQLLQEMAKLADKATGKGRIMERAPFGLKMTEFNLEEFRKAIIKELLKQGVILDDFFKGFDIDLHFDVFVKLFRPNIRAGMNQLIIYKDGQPVLYDIEPEAYETLAGLNAPVITKFMKLLMKVGDFQAACILYTPRFIAWNTARESMTSYLQTRAGITFMDIGKGALSVLMKDQWYRETMKRGGLTEMFLANEDRFAKDVIGDLLRSRKWYNTVIHKIQHPLNTLREAVEFTELGTKVAEAKKTVQNKQLERFAQSIGKPQYITRLLKTLDPATRAQWNQFFKITNATAADWDEAIFNMRDMTYDIKRTGRKMRKWSINRIWRFSKAYSQGIDQMIRAGLDPKRNKRLFYRGLLLAMISLYLWELVKDNPWYQNLTPYLKDNFWMFPIGNPKTTKTFIPMPKGFEWALLFSAVPVRFADAYFYQNPQAWDGFDQSVVNNFLFDLAPLPAQPIIEEWTGMQWQGLPIENMSDERVSPYLRYDSRTSEAAKGIAQITKGLPDWKTLDTIRSPKRIDHVIKGYTGTWGKVILGELDDLMGKSNYSPATVLEQVPYFSHLQNVPGVNSIAASFFVDAERSNTIREKYYDRKQMYERFHFNSVEQGIKPNIDAFTEVLQRLEAKKAATKDASLDATIASIKMRIWKESMYKAFNKVENDLGDMRKAKEKIEKAGGEKAKTLPRVIDSTMLGVQKGLLDYSRRIESEMEKQKSKEK